MLGLTVAAERVFGQVAGSRPAAEGLPSGSSPAGVPSPSPGEPRRVGFNMLEMASTQAAHRSLQSSVRFLWDQQPLRQGLAALGNAHRLSIWLDRRVDPGMLVSYVPDDKHASPRWPVGSLGARLDQILNQLNLEMGLIESVLYIGPVGEASKLQRAAIVLQDTVHRMAPEIARQTKDWSWEELSTPQQLLDQLAQEWRLEIQGELPHDLLHAGQLAAPTHLATQLVLICSGFSKEPHWLEPQRIQLIPLENHVAWTATYPKSKLRTLDLPALRGIFPDCKLKFNGASCELTGETGFHLAMLQDARPNGGREKPGKLTVWSFAIDRTPADALVANLASGIGLRIEWSPECTREQKTQLLSLKVEQATLDQLLTQVCEAAGVKFVRDGTHVVLSPP